MHHLMIHSLQPLVQKHTFSELLPNTKAYTTFLQTIFRKMSHDFLFKLILVGDSSVGKTALLQRFTDPSYKLPALCEATVGVDFKTRNVTISGKEVMLMTWDTAVILRKYFIQFQSQNSNLQFCTSQGSRSLSLLYPSLLQRIRRGPVGLRHREPRLLYTYSKLVRRRQGFRR